MAGPSFSGPLTGWTSSTLAPKATVVIQTAPPAVRDPLVNLPGGGLTPAEKTANNQRYSQLKQEASAAEKVARDSNDPAKLMEAYRLTTLAEQHRPLAATVAEHKQNFNTAIDAFKARNPGFVAPAIRTSPGIDFNNLMGSAGGSSVPATASASGAATSGGNLGQYDLNDSELGAIPNPRLAPRQTNGLESLLAAIFPDAAASGALTNPQADARTGGQAPSLLNTILGNLGQQPQATTGGPSFNGPASVGGNGAAIAATIPGAPGFLGGAINNVQGGMSGFVPAPVVSPAASLGNTLAGVAAISAEQRIQQQQAEAKRQAEALAFYEQTRQRQAAADEAARMQRLRGGAGGWNAPINLTDTQQYLRSFQPPVAPTFQSYTPVY